VETKSLQCKAPLLVPPKNASILLLGGTFDPVHCGHLLMLRAAKEHFGYDEAWLIPASRAPHKQIEPRVADVHRLGMLRCAIRREPGFRVWEGELLRGGVSWTIDTIRELRRIYGDIRMGWLIGGDHLPGLHLWKEAFNLMQECELYVVRRPGEEPLGWTSERLKLPADWCASLPQRTLSFGGWDVSSTQVRGRILEGKSIKWFVPDVVEEYIHRFSLYGRIQSASTGDAS